MLVEDSFFGNSDPGRHFRTMLEASLSGEELAQLDSLCFVLIKPDAVLAGKADPIVRQLESCGLKLVWAQLLQSPAEWQFEELYKFNLTLYNAQNQIGAWWLNRQIYLLGPSIALLFRPASGPRNGLSCARHIATLKGPSSPYKASAGQIRWDFRATNRSLNLMHSADGPLSTAREFLIFQERAQLQALLAELAAHHAPKDRALGAICGAFGTSDISFDFRETLTAVKRRLGLCAFGDRQQEVGDALAALWQRSKRTCSPGEEVEAVRSTGAAERAILATVSSTGLPALEALALLASPESYGPEIARRLPEQLKSSRIHFSEVELLVLQTSIFYFCEDAIVPGTPPSCR